MRRREVAHRGTRLWHEFVGDHASGMSDPAPGPEVCVVEATGIMLGTGRTVTRRPGVDQSEVDRAQIIGVDLHSAASFR